MESPEQVSRLVELPPQAHPAGDRREGRSSDVSLDLRHLRAELARIDLLIRRQVRRWRLAGQNPADTFRGLYITEAEIDGLLERPFGNNWGETIPLPAGETACFERAAGQAAHQLQAIVAEAEGQGQTLRLAHLAAAFCLDRFELDTLLICLAASLDVRYERFYGYLQDDTLARRPTVNLVLDLLGEPGPERLWRLAYFADDAPLFHYRLLDRIVDPGKGELPLLRQQLNPDETITAWLLGHYRPHPGLAGQAALADPRTGQTNPLVTAGVWPHLQPLLAEPEPIFVFYGPDQAGQHETARLSAREVGRPLLQVNLAGVIAAGQAPVTAVTLALRDARLTGAIPYLDGWDACLEAGRGLPALLAEIYRHPDVVIIAGQRLWQPPPAGYRRSLFWLDFPTPAYPQRLALWRHFLGDSHELISEADLTVLAAQFALTGGQICQAVGAARDTARQQRGPLHHQHLFAAARAYSNPNLATLARKIVPRYVWSDIILPASQLAILQEIATSVRERPRVLDDWGLGEKLVSSRGVTVLFAGPSGTGKTMAAEVIAGELGLDIYRIDLSTVVSKYIGETEKNLEKIFSEAQSSNAILFFDEADAIFGKRSEVKDAHDRYANIEISYLLQRMEDYDGVTILATNLRANLDEAFTRRLQFAVDFPFPGPQDRLRIWQTLFPPHLPRDPNIDFNLLAERFKLAGGNIRNIIVNAAYLAATDGGRVSMSHLLHSTRRELQKMGRLVGDADLKKMGLP